MIDMKWIIHSLQNLGHEELIASVGQLNASKLKALSHQLALYQNYPKESFMYSDLPPQPYSLTPPQMYNIAPEDSTYGKQAIQDGKVHAILLAGGDGSRLKFQGPKALFPIEKDKKLIDYFLEDLPPKAFLTLLCSDSNIKSLAEYVPSPHMLLMQHSFPLLTLDYKWKLKDDGTILDGPNGNGSLLEILKETHSIEKFRALGIEHFVILNIDNPLLSPYDTQLIGHHIRQGNDLTIRGFEKDPKDPVGVFAVHNNRMSIIDYTTQIDQSLFHIGNTNHMCLTIDFLTFLCEKVSLPLHWVKKESLYQGSPLSVFKAERFITDICPYAKQASVLLTDKKTHFAPLKKREDLQYICRSLRKQKMD